MQRLFLPFLLLLVPADLPPSAGAAQDPATVTLARRDFEVPVDVDGSFLPADAAEIQLWPKEYAGDWMFLEVLPHGSYVNAGDVIARFDRERYDEQLHQSELDYASAALGQHVAEEQARMEEQQEQEQLENARAGLERARKDLKGWEDFELKFQERQEALSEAGAKDGLSDQEDELAQLEAMYRGDELVDATEELVLKRNRRQLARSQQYAELGRDQRQYHDEYEVAQQTEVKRESLRNQESAFTRLQAGQALSRAQRQDRSARGTDALQRQQQKLEALRADGALFELHAPRGGVLLHGAPDDYGPGKAPPRHERAGHAGPHGTLFSVGDPDRMSVAVTVDESDLGRVREGMAAKVSAPGAAGNEWLGTLKLERFPEPGQNRYAGWIRFDQPVRGLVPGMKARVSLVTETLHAQFVVPRSAVFGSGADAAVYVADHGGAGYRRVGVKTGAGRDNELVVTGELNEGDRVLLAEPGK